MRIVLQNNLNDKTFKLEPEQREIENLDGFQELVKNTVSQALEVADAVWKEHPDFKQIILDTTTDEERKLMAMAKQTKGGGN